jgi:hypothetical protein
MKVSAPQQNVGNRMPFLAGENLRNISEISPLQNAAKESQPNENPVVSHLQRAGAEATSTPTLQQQARTIGATVTLIIPPTGINPNTSQIQRKRQEKSPKR